MIWLRRSYAKYAGYGLAYGFSRQIISWVKPDGGYGLAVT